MRWLIASRASGKTTRLIIESYAIKAIIVCVNTATCKSIKARAVNLKLSIPKPITYSDFIILKDNTKDTYLIDEIDDFLHYAFHNKKISVVTLTPKARL